MEPSFTPVTGSSTPPPRSASTPSASASSTCARRRSATRPRITSSPIPAIPEPWLELTHNHDRTEPYEIGTGLRPHRDPVDDLDATLAALDEKGVQPERAPYLVGTTRICFVRDPDGYRIELIERP